MSFGKSAAGKALAVSLAVGLLGLSLAGCGGAPSSSESLSSSAPPVASAPSSSSVASSLPPPAAETGPLSLADFSAYLDGTMVLSPRDVAFGRFTFVLNAEGHKLDPQTLSTLRGLRVGERQQRVEALYGELPVEIRQSGPSPANWSTERYASYNEYLQSGEMENDYHAVFSFYEIDGEAAESPEAVQSALAANAYGQNHSVLRYDLDLHMQSGGVSDITLAVNETTPFVLGYLAPQQVVDDPACRVAVNGLFGQAESFGLNLSIYNGFDRPVFAVCVATTVNGKATRDVGFLYQYIDPGMQVNTALVIPNDAVRAAGVFEVESVGFALEIRSEQGQTLFQTENITLPLVYPEEPEEPEE